MKVLIIEDDKLFSFGCARALQANKIEIEQAYDGLAGLEMAQKIKPDLILLDLILPKLHGFGVLEDLKADKKLKNIPVVICSALNQKKDIDEAMKLGALHYMSKENYSQQQIVQFVVETLKNANH